MAITLAILGILLAGLLPSLPAHMENQRRQHTTHSLQQIQELLLAYAAIHGRLPCPTREEDPSSVHYGLEHCASAAAEEGYLPWRDLGVPAVDAWGRPRQMKDDTWQNHWLYRVDALFTAERVAMDDLTGAGALRLQVRDAHGSLLTNLGQPPVALVCSIGANGRKDGENASVEPGPKAVYQYSPVDAVFDDICSWISRPMLASALIRSGRLP